MPGRGAAPGDPNKRTGHRQRPQLRLVENKAAPQPKLPDRTWPNQTKVWWKMWGNSPLTDEFTENDWSELLDTATIHAKLWDPRTPPTIALKAAGELRQRAAKFGATPEDRMRLRIQFAFAERAEDQAEEAKERKEARKERGARQRRGPHVANEGN
jgi:hypothetical protein